MVQQQAPANAGARDDLRDFNEDNNALSGHELGSGGAIIPLEEVAKAEQLKIDVIEGFD